MLRDLSGLKQVKIIDPVTGLAANVEQNGGLAVNIQDQSSTPIDSYFLKSISDFTYLL